MKRINIGTLFGVGAIVGALVGLGAGIAITIKASQASRNSSGTMSAINGPFAAPSVISSAAINARLSDIENEITNSVDKGGRTVMTQPLPLSNGTAALPSLTFGSDTDTGLYRIGADNPGLTVAGSKRQEWSTTGTSVTGTLAVSSTSTLTGKVGIGGAPSTNLLEIVGASEPALTIQNTAMTNSPALFIGMNNGNTAAVFQTQSATNYGYKFLNGAGTGLLTIAATGGLTSVTLNTGVAADGSGFKHASFGAGCTTAAAAGATCTSTFSWTTAFADSSYDCNCTCVTGGAGNPVVGRITRAAATVAVVTVALDANAAQCGNVSCIAVHN